MAAYATVADAELIYGSAVIATYCDRDGDGDIDGSSFDKHLEIASREMDGYLLGRYPLPLNAPPENFKKLCIDIAIYNAAGAAPVLTKTMEDRYKAAIEYMKLIATNKVKLATSDDATSPNASNSPRTLTRKGQAGLVQPGARTFSRKSTKGIL